MGLLTVPFFFIHQLFRKALPLLNSGETGGDCPDKIAWLGLNPVLSASPLTQHEFRTQVKDIPGGSPESLVDIGSAFSWATLSGKVPREASVWLN